MAKIKVKNRKTGVESEMTNDEWEKTKKNPLFEGVFVVVQKTETPQMNLKIIYAPHSSNQKMKMWVKNDQHCLS